MALAQNKFLPTMSKEIKDIYDRLPSEDDIITQQRERQQYYSLNEVKKALEKNRGREEAVYRTMADSLTRDKDAMRELLRDDPRVWKYIHPELRMDMDMKRTCLSSHNNHMQTMNINGQNVPMYSSQVPTDVLNDPRVVVPAYHQAYQGQIQEQIQGQSLDSMNPQGQRLEDRLMTMEMVIRAKSNPEIQQALNQTEREVIRNNKDDVARVATKDPSIMDAVEARAPEAKKEIETKRQEYEMAYLRGDAMDRARTDGALDYAGMTEHNVNVTASSQSSAVEGIARADNYTQDGVEEIQQEQTYGDPEYDEYQDISNEEKYQQWEEKIGRNNDSDGDGIRNRYDQDPYQAESQEEDIMPSFSPFSSPSLLDVKDPADIFDNPFD